MDYQSWLKVFSVELSHQKRGVSMDDLDPLFLQSLFQKGVSPVEAVNKALVLRGYKVEGDDFLASTLQAVRWDYMIPAAALILMAFVVLRSNESISETPIIIPSHTQRNFVAKSDGDFFALGDISYGTPYPSNFRRAEGRSTKPGYASRTTYADVREATNPAAGAPAGFSDSGNPSSAAALALSSSTDLSPTRTSSRSQGGSGSPSSAPDIQQFQVTTSAVDAQGYSGEVTWTVTNGQEVQLYLQGQFVPGASGSVGNIPFAGLADGSIFTLRVTGNGKTVEQNAAVAPPFQSGT